MYMCIYVCVHIYVYKYVCIYISTYLFIYKYVALHVCVNEWGLPVAWRVFDACAPRTM